MQDSRDKFLVEMEEKIQERARKKDKSFVLSGPWKKFVREQDGFKVYVVDGEWVRNNLSIIFEHGGHGFVHEFIPLDEIWVDVRHYEGCPCRNVREDRKMSQEYFESTVIHEITEFREMDKGKTYWEAHQIALKKESKAGILKDPHTETGE